MAERVVFSGSDVRILTLARDISHPVKLESQTRERYTHYGRKRDGEWKKKRRRLSRGR